MEFSVETHVFILYSSKISFFIELKTQITDTKLQQKINHIF